MSINIRSAFGKAKWSSKLPTIFDSTAILTEVLEIG